MKRKELDLGLVVEMANSCRHIDTTAEHVAAMIDADHVDLVVGIWTDPMGPDGIANEVFKESDLFEGERRRHRGKLCAFWLKNEAHAEALAQELEQLVIKNTTVRGEFLPIKDDVAFEAVPTAENPEAFYVVKAGVRLARRGRPGTREAKRWIPLFPGHEVRDVGPNAIEIRGGSTQLCFGYQH